MRGRLTALLIVGLVIATVVVSITLLQQTEDARTPDTQPTRTPVSGQATVIFDQVNDGRAQQGLPTFTPGLSSTEMISTAVQATLVTETPDPTLTPTVTNTPPPTHTAIPTNTLVPGVATRIFTRLQEIQAGSGALTATPGVPLDVFIEQSAQGTATALAQP